MPCPRLLLLPVAALVAACTVDEMPGPSEGEKLFVENCAACHGLDATGGELIGGQLAPDLTILAAQNGGVFPRARALSAIDGYGKGRAASVMPEFGALLVDAETVPVEVDGTLTPTPRPMAAVLAYLESIQTNP